jgi:hypothetical protein
MDSLPEVDLETELIGKPWFHMLDYDDASIDVYVYEETYDNSLPDQIGGFKITVKVGWWNHPEVTPLCCQEIQECCVVYLTWPPETPSVEFLTVAPKWATRAPEKYHHRVWVTYCPFCGEALPDIERRLELPKMIWTPAGDGDHYCATCGERNMGCGCLRPTWYWQPKGLNEDVVEWCDTDCPYCCRTWPRLGRWVCAHPRAPQELDLSKEYEGKLPELCPMKEGPITVRLQEVSDGT